VSASRTRRRLKISCPVYVLAGIALCFTIPQDFPYQGSKKKPSRAVIGAVVFTEAALMLVALVLLLAGLEQVSSKLDWTSATTISLLCSSGVAWVGVLFSQYHASNAEVLYSPFSLGGFSRIERRQVLYCMLHFSEADIHFKIIFF
jgi:hypothetical protein